MCPAPSVPARDSPAAQGLGLSSLSPGLSLPLARPSPCSVWSETRQRVKGRLYAVPPHQHLSSTSASQLAPQSPEAVALAAAVQSVASPRTGHPPRPGSDTRRPPPLPAAATGLAQAAVDRHPGASDLSFRDRIALQRWELLRGAGRRSRTRGVTSEPRGDLWGTYTGPRIPWQVPVVDQRVEADQAVLDERLRCPTYSSTGSSSPIATDRRNPSSPLKEHGTPAWGPADGTVATVDRTRA